LNPKDLVGAKKAPLRYVPAALMIEASGPMEDGAIKYGPFNWREQPVEMVTYLEAIQRHLLALLDGQDYAEDSGHSHLGHIIAGAGIIADAKANGTLIDNRFAPGPAADMLRERDKSAIKADAEPVIYLKRDEPTTVVPFQCCGSWPEHNLLCVNWSAAEEWGKGDGPVYDSSEALDGCVEYRGRHVLASEATEATFRSIDRDIESRLAS
jgi:hypothetical protein